MMRFAQTDDAILQTDGAILQTDGAISQTDGAILQTDDAICANLNDCGPVRLICRRRVGKTSKYDKTLD
jgi:hypothetical protein